MRFIHSERPLIDPDSIDYALNCCFSPGKPSNLRTCGWTQKADCSPNLHSLASSTRSLALCKHERVLFSRVSSNPGPPLDRKCKTNPSCSKQMRFGALNSLRRTNKNVSATKIKALNPNWRYFTAKHVLIEAVRDQKHCRIQTSIFLPEAENALMLLVISRVLRLAPPRSLGRSCLSPGIRRPNG